METLILREHEQRVIDLSGIEVDTLRRYFTKQFEIWPSLEPNKYVVRAQSYAGVIVLPSGRTIFIEPKIQIQTLFALLARVYDPNKEIFFDQPFPYTTISELFEFIVSFFASHAEDLIARGLLRGYQTQIEDSQAIRGRLLIAETIHHHPGLYDVHWCSYRHFTPDIPENRILLWTTFISRAWNFSDLGLTGRLYRVQRILADVHLDPHARLLVDRLEFHRLNESYQPAITLARLILDHLSFTGTQGTEPFLAYLIDMDVLFQQYLTIVLQQEVTKTGFWVREEETHPLDLGGQIIIRPDLLLYKGENPLLVVDAKYKLSAAQEDLYQMLAYCHALGLNRAILVHPSSETAPTGSVMMRGPGDICVEYMSISLSGGPQQLNDHAAQLVDRILNTICKVEPIA